jgi:hypothetical protein
MAGANGAGCVFFEPREVVLRDERTETDRRWLVARYQPKGDLVFEGHDFGEGVRAYWGSAEYEWVWTVKSHDVPKLMRALGIWRRLLTTIQQRFSGPQAANLAGFLQANGIPYVAWSRTGD